MLTGKCKYTGTTQLCAKAFHRGAYVQAAALPTVQVNVDLGMLALLATKLNDDWAAQSTRAP